MAEKLYVNRIFVTKSHEEKLLNTAATVVIQSLEIGETNKQDLKMYFRIYKLQSDFCMCFIYSGELELFIGHPAFHYLKFKIKQAFKNVLDSIES